MLDNVLYLDSISKEQSYENNALHTTLTHQGYHARSFNWPYYSFATMEQQILILNAFNIQFVQKYQLPENVSKVERTFLTDSHDLFCLVQTFDHKYQLLNIDLDSLDPFLSEPIFTYSFDEVNYK